MLKNILRKSELSFLRFNHYHTLGIKYSAERDEIKNAYLEKAKKFHPDRNKDDPNAAEKFQNIQEAFAVLSAKKSRTKYDKQNILIYREKLKEDDLKGYKFKGTWEANFGGAAKHQKADDHDDIFNPDPFEEVYKKDDTFRKMGMEGIDLNKYNMDGFIDQKYRQKRGRPKKSGPGDGEAFSQLFKDRKNPSPKKRGRKQKS